MFTVMKHFYFEVWARGYVEAENIREARKKIQSEQVSNFKKYEDADTDIMINEEDF